MKKDESFIIFDGNALLHRAWHAIPPLTSPNGVVVNAVYGFMNIVEKVIDTHHPQYIAVAWDLPGKTFRHEQFVPYKAQREKKEQALYDQIPMIQKILGAYGIPCLSAEGFEADDVIATLATKYSKEVPVTILTGDADTLQLVSDDIEVLSFIKGISETKTFDAAAVKEKFGVTPAQMVDYKTLMGDPSDNLPGVKGIGKKTAVIMLQTYGTVDGIFKALKNNELSGRAATNLHGQEAVAEEMKGLVTLVKDVPMTFKLSDAKFDHQNKEEIRREFADLGFRKLFAKYSDEPQEFKSAKSTSAKAMNLSEFTNNEVFLAVRGSGNTLFGENLESIAVYDGKKVFSISNPKEKEIASILSFLNSATLVVGHDLKTAMHFIGKIEAPLFDTMVAAYLLSPGTRVFDLETVLREQMKSEKSVESAEAEVAILLELSEILKKNLKKEEMWKLSEEIEMPLIAILFEMEQNGIQVDEYRLADLSKEFETELASLTKEIFKLAGEEFNINSPSQMAHILFNVMKLPTKGLKKTKSGYSTAAPELEKLWDENPIVEKISQFREFSKLKSTYVDALPLLLKSDGRIHTTYNQTVAATGRLSSSDPNLQNIPTRTELGQEIRKAFVAPRGSVLLSMDYSQFELRLVAVMAHDKAFIEAFQKGADIHRVVAAQILGKKDEDVTKAERQAAKAINFGILYGMGPRHLARSTGFEMDVAKKFIDKYFELHPGIQKYIDSMKEKAKKDGYVETLFGRKRYLPDIDSGIQMLVSGAERMAVNMPVQGTQADLVKMAMIEVHKWMQKQDIPLKLLLQVHDELVFELAEKDLKKVMEPIREIMQGIWKSEVPLIVDCEAGHSWGTLEAV
ncbi:MAG: DNA polymerase I [Patescibacteria group bacterium]